MKHFKLFLLATCTLSILASCSDEPVNVNPPTEEPTQFDGDIDFVKTIGGSNNETANGVAATADGGVVVVGTTRSIDGDISDKTAPNFDVWVVKLNADGAIEWSKTYGGTNDDFGESIIVSTDGGYAFTGSNRSDDGDTSSNGGSYDQWVVKLDSAGNIEWESSFGFAGRDEAFSIIQTQDGGYFIGGVLDFTNSDGQGEDGLTDTKSAQHAGGEYWGTKLSPNGNLEFRRYFGGSKDDRCEGVVQTADGGFILAGRSESIDFDVENNKGQYDFWAVKVGTEKTLSWEQTYGGSGIDSGYSITPLSDGNYLMSGDTRSSDQDVDNLAGNADFWLVKIDASGNLIIESTIGGTQFDSSRAAIEMTSGELAFAGNTRSNDGDLSSNNGQNDAYVGVTDSMGNLIKGFSIGGSQLDFLNGITQTTDGAIFAVGSTGSSDFDIAENKGDDDILIIKIK